MAGFLLWYISLVGPGDEVDVGMYLGGIFRSRVFWTWRSCPEGGGDDGGAFRRPVETLQKGGALQISSMVVLNYRQVCARQIGRQASSVGNNIIYTLRSEHYMTNLKLKELGSAHSRHHLVHTFGSSLLPVLLGLNIQPRFEPELFRTATFDIQLVMTSLQ